MTENIGNQLPRPGYVHLAGGPLNSFRPAAVMLLLTLAACGEAPEKTEEAKQMISLPQPKTESGNSLESSLARRRSVRQFSDRPLDQQTISQLLWAAQGITDKQRGFRTAPSAGATFPLVAYALTGDGVFRYHPEPHQLERLSGEDRRPELAAAALNQQCVRQAPLVLVFSAAEGRTTGHYGNRGLMYVHMEAGHAAQNVLLQAVALDLGAVPVGAFDPASAGRILGVPPQEKVLYLLPVGIPAAR